MPSARNLTAALAIASSTLALMPSSSWANGASVEARDNENDPSTPGGTLPPSPGRVASANGPDPCEAKGGVTIAPPPSARVGDRRVTASGQIQEFRLLPNCAINDNVRRPFSGYWETITTVGDITDDVYVEVVALLDPPAVQFDPTLEPYQIVNLEMALWVPPAQWNQVVQVTKTVDPVTITITARPTALRFHPGDGSDAIECDSGGKPHLGPSQGGCGHVYRRVSDHNDDLAYHASAELVWRAEIDRTFSGDEVRTVSTTTDYRVPVFQVQTVEVPSD